VNNLSDSELVAKADQGEEWALEEFLERYKLDLLYYIWGEVNDKDIVDGLYDDVLVEFREGFVDRMKNESARDYLFCIAEHVVGVASYTIEHEEFLG